MANGLKRLGISAAALIAGVALMFGLATWLIDRSQVTQAVERQIRATTGLDLVLRDNVSVSLFPASSVTFRNVMLRGDGRDEPAMSVGEMTASLRLLPLLMRRFEIADLTLTDPRAVVTRSGATTNWAGIVETLARTLKPGPDSPVSFSEIRIKGGALIYQDRTNGILETLESIDLSLAWPSISKSFGATGDFKWRGRRLDASLTLSDFIAALSGRVSGLKIRLAGEQLKFAFDGTLATAPQLTADGALSADTASLREVLRWADREPPVPGGMGRAALNAKVNIAGSRINLSGINLELDGNTAEGVLGFSGDGRQTLQGTLATETLDLTPYLVSMRGPQSRDWSRRPFDIASISRVDLDIRLSAAAIKLGTSRLGRTALSANVTGGALTLSIAEANVFGGIAKGSITATPIEGQSATIKTQFQMADVDLESSMGELLGIRKVSGKGTMSVALEASGANSYELAQSVNGKATLIGREGALAGFNVEQLLRRLERRPLSGTGDFRNGRTPFRTIDIGLRIVDGIANIEDARMESATVKMAMTGSTSIPAREIDLRGAAALVATGSEPPFELPFVVQGPWDNPMILPDTEILLKRSPFSAPLLNSVRERRTRDALKNAIDRLTNPSSAAPAPQGEPAQ
jgi:AsmA protein